MISQNYVLNPMFFAYIHDCHKRGQQSDFSEKFDFLCNQLDTVLFGFSPDIQNLLV